MKELKDSPGSIKLDNDLTSQITRSLGKHHVLGIIGLKPPNKAAFLFRGVWLNIQQ